MRDVTATQDIVMELQDISTHTSHAGRDVALLAIGWMRAEFLLTRPMRDVTLMVSPCCPLMAFLLTRPMRDVTQVRYSAGILKQFLLTRPMRDVTHVAGMTWHRAPISTHTSHAGRDSAGFPPAERISYFYSHVPCGT